MRLRVHAQQRGFVGERRRLALDQRIDAARDQLIFDCLQARGTFGMPLPHVVQQTVGVRIETCCHDFFLRARRFDARAACLLPGARALGAPTSIKLPHDAAVARSARFCRRRRVYCPDPFFPCPSRTAPFAHYDRQACSVRTKPASHQHAGRLTFRRIVHVHGNQSGARAKHRQETAGAGRAKPAATHCAARANVRRRDHSAALREQSQCRCVHQRHGRALRLRRNRTACAVFRRQLFGDRGQARHAVAFADGEELARISVALSRSGPHQCRRALLAREPGHAATRIRRVRRAAGGDRRHYRRGDDLRSLHGQLPRARRADHAHLRLPEHRQSRAIARPPSARISKTIWCGRATHRSTRPQCSAPTRARSAFRSSCRAASCNTR